MVAVQEYFVYVLGLLSTLGQTVRVWDILDIAVIAYLIYRVLTVMRKTSAGSVIKGIILILIVVWLTNFLNLKVVNYLLTQVTQMGVVVLVVLFQPELRRFFEQMGSSNLNFMFKKRGKREYLENAIHNVVTAGESMSKSKTGALIVFERDIGLNDYAATGTKIDALITSELLQNIFYKNSPLHDGAVIVRDGRILAAACMLPMSNNFGLSRDLGMRHRAGVGISERSDALAVIVSEQTGTISVASDGMLKRHLARDTFERLLRNELLESSGSSKSRELKVKK